MPAPDLTDYDEAVWVSSDVSPRGDYRLTVHYTPDRSISLDPIRALTYVNQAVAVAARAEYAAAVLAQLAHMGLDNEDARRVTVAEIMDGIWEAVDLADGVRLVPLVAARNRRPYVVLEVDGQHITQWSPDELHDHAMNLLRVRACVDLGARYKRYLTTRLELDDETAERAVGDLANHRKDSDDDE